MGAEYVPAVAAHALASELVSVTGCQTLEDMTSKVQGCEIDLDHFEKRGSCQVHIVEGPEERPKTSDHQVKGQ